MDAQTKEPVVFASIRIEDRALGVISNLEGDFRVPLDYAEKGAELEISSMGYETKTYKIKAGESATKDISIQFKASDVILMGSVVVGGVHKTKRTFFQKIGDWFR